MPDDKTYMVEDTETGEEIELVEKTVGDSRLDELFAELDAHEDAKVNVYANPKRMGRGATGKWPFLFSFLKGDYNSGELMEKLRDEYGTGEYRCQGREQKGILKTITISVFAPEKTEQGAPRAASEFGTTELMALMTKQNENTQAMFANMITAMSTMFSGAAQNQPTVNPIEQQNALLEGITRMKELSGADDKGPSPIEMMLKGIELAKDMAPKTGETNANDIFLKALEAFPALAQAGKTAAQGGMPRPAPMGPKMPVPGTDPRPVVRPDPRIRAVPDPGQNPAPVNPAPENEATKEQAEFFAQAREHLQGLCRLAAQDKDPEIYAPMIVDQMGEEAVKEFIGHDNALDKLSSIEPTVNLYPGWFNHLKEAILDIIQPETEPAPEEAPIIKDGPEGAPVSDEPEELTPELVLGRINESGLRREGQQNAPILIPAPDGQTDVVWFGSDSEPASDT